jgi:hypothetical protein
MRPDKGEVAPIVGETWEFGGASALPEKKKRDVLLVRRN